MYLKFIILDSRKMTKPNNKKNDSRMIKQSYVGDTLSFVFMFLVIVGMGFCILKEAFLLLWDTKLPQNKSTKQRSLMAPLSD